MSSAQLRKLHQQLDNCRQCLEASYSIVPKAIYSGVHSAKIMVIGQAPGVTEAQAGRPFNAGSGTRLFDWLRAAGFNEKRFRSEQYMTSVTKCFPGKSKNGGGDRVPSRQEQNLCRSYLDREIELINPIVIIPVGRLAINLFFSSRMSLAEIVGCEIRVDDRIVVPLPHPSGASRWHQIPKNRERINLAIKKIWAIRESLGI